MNLPLPIRILLWPVSWIYGLASRLRVILYDRGIFKKQRLRAPVVSVGNLTVGGTGKTPMVLYLAERFLAEGKRVGILSRGYCGSGGTSDEIEMLRQRLGNRVVFGVGPDRYSEGRRVEKENSIDVFLLDDGFQHIKLVRDVDILLVDGSKRTDKEWLLPAGALREPFTACSRADLLVLSRTIKPFEREVAARDSVFYAQTKLLGLRGVGEKSGLFDVGEVREHSFYAFCGIGNPQAFYRDLKLWNLAVSGTMSFRDHHRYSTQDAETLLASVRGARATALITTEKDEQNLRDVDFGDIPVYVAVIEFSLSSEREFHDLLEHLLQKRREVVA